MLQALLALGFTTAAAIAMVGALERKRVKIFQTTGRWPTVAELVGLVTRSDTGPKTGATASARPFVLDQGVFVRGMDEHRVVQSGPRAGEVRPHWGMDIGAPEGTPVHAVKSGTVVVARPVSGYGNCIWLSHTGENTSSLYGHLSSMAVTEGQQVQAGAMIGAVGHTLAGRQVRVENGQVISTGVESTSGISPIGPHLHLEIHPWSIPRIGPTPRRTDPVRWLSRQQPPIDMFASRYRPPAGAALTVT